MEKTNRLLNRQKKVTIVFGYSLFLVTLVMLTITTIIPWTVLFFDPSVEHINVAIILISLVAGAILPALVSYVMGDRATHIKNKTSHHYNGVLFGVAAYWLTLLFIFIRIGTIPSIRESFSEPWASIVSLWPVFATILVMLFVAISYARNQKSKTSVLQHRPYQVVLVGGAIAFLAYVTIIQDFTINILPNIISLLLPLLLITIGYKVLAKSLPSRSMRISESVIAMTMGGISASLVAQIISYMNPATSIFVWLVSQLAGVYVWMLYLRLISKTK